MKNVVVNISSRLAAILFLPVENWILKSSSLNIQAEILSKPMHVTVLISGQSHHCRHQTAI
jgi:hypothetical protein